MSSPATPLAAANPAEMLGRSAALAMVSLAAGLALLAGCAPLGVSIVTVFLFAGPHNWLEARYFLTRMPPRWGALRSYFTTGIAGVLALTGAFAALPALGRFFAWDRESWNVAIACWNTALVVWIVVLATMRARTNPRRDWSYLLPVAGCVIGLGWLWPIAWDLGLFYVHPLVALWFLDRELGRHRPEWQPAYRKMLAIVPLLLGLLWWRLIDSPDLPGTDALTTRITHHAGASVLSGVSTRLLVATHVFLESIHYAVWLLAIPLIASLSTPWRVERIPLAQRSGAWRKVVVGILAVGAALVVLIWAGFLTDYPLTRDVYFTVGMLHVLAEVPFLLRLL